MMLRSPIAWFSVPPLTVLATPLAVSFTPPPTALKSPLAMFEASLVTFMVGATFLNRAHFDLFYHWVALIMVFGHVADKDMEDAVLHPVKEGTRGPIRALRSPGYAPRPAFNAFARETAVRED